ncbi:MAG: diguanylate cyclase [Candidatus Thiodiazotropha sp. (ex Lucinoma kastoroae)]|nr:diguanylate cyclase [Candidatus Thiodiazotropha sp. (ex Lucinoma kastoroae)]MCU7860731.1 diguanylate cyclase [Candidatus Thiodiazotropha sp. (ex Lucinoma kastoroae)]
MDDSSPYLELPRFIRDMPAIGLVAVDRRMNIIMWNKFMEIHSQLHQDEVLGRNLFDSFPELPIKWLEKKLKTIMVLKNTAYSSWQQRPCLFKFTNVSAITTDVEYMYQDCSFWALKDESGNVLGVCMTVYDVTETAISQQLLEEATEHAINMEESSLRDGLTGLYNRRYLDKQINQEIQLSKRYNWDLSLAMVDIDFFKKVNDQYGHDAGDEVLQSVSNTMMGQLRGTDILCRYGGEEFALIMPKINLEKAASILDRLRSSIETSSIRVGDQSISVSVSMGVSQYSEQSTLDELFKQADHALYQSKKNGRNRVTLYNV